ncbi:MAG TPA: S-adenosylmethionine decarboxylase [Gemmatimonadales bacterium]|nr:S-adenosylmethionine decarboxylase [Gemmatimonadales bacterium]
MTASHRLTNLTGIPGQRLGDPESLSAVAIAAAASVGMSSYGTPIVKSGPRGTVVGLLCHGGHVIVHAIPEESRCLVDILVMAPGNAADRGIEVIARRLGGKPEKPIPE